MQKGQGEYLSKKAPLLLCARKISFYFIMQVECLKL